MSDGLKVVVADDDDDTREYLRLLLERHGHDVRSAEDGRRLVEVCHGFAADLIVTDFAMPGLDGLSAAAEACRDRSVPVVLISGRVDLEEQVAGSRLTVSLLAKPVKEAELLAAVAAACSGPLARP